MALQSEPVAHNGLVAGSDTTLHSHTGGGGGADIKAGNETTITEGGSRSVTFTTAFSATPNVVVGFSDNSTQISVCSAHTVSTSGFTIMVVKSGGGGNSNRDVSWIATDAGDL